MALSLLCGGLGVASAADSTVHVDASTTPGNATEVYTTTGVNTLLADYGKKSDVENNKNSITTMNTTITTQGQSIATNVANIANNTKAIEKKIDTEAADLKYATKEALADKADQTTVTALDGRVGDVEGKVAALEGNITALQNKTAKLSPDGKSLTGMDKVETDALKVTGQISNGTVNTTLEAIDASMKQTVKNKEDIATLQGTTNGQQTAIDDLKQRTKEISYADGDGTRISGVTIKDGNIVGNGNSAITGLTKVETDSIKTDSINGKSLEGTKVATEKEVKAETDAREAADTALGQRIDKEIQDREAADNGLSGRITDNAKEIARVNQELVKTNKHFNTELGKTNDYFNKELGKTNNHFNTELGKTNAALQEEGKVRANADAALASDITATNKRTAGIGRTDTGVEADNQTVIEGTVHFDQKGNVSGVKDLKTDTIHATGEIISKGLDAGDGDIKTNGKVSAGDVSTGTLETTGNAKIGGDLTVNGKLNVGEIYMEHKKQESTGEEYDSATSITADGISNNAKVTDRNGVKTESKFTHDKEGSTTYAYQGDAANWKKSTSNVTADGVENVAEDSKGNNNTFTQTSTDTKNTLTDKAGNTSTTRQDSKGIYGYAKDKDGNKSYTKQEGNRIAESVIGQDGKQTKSEMTSTNITNTAKDGTITSDAKDIVNKATGNISNSSATMDTTVTGKATESYGELETEVKGNEKHTVKGDQTNEVDGKQINTIKNGQENIISGGQTNTITGGQINNITGDQTTTITGNKTETVTENVTEDYKKDLTTTVGGNEIHEVKGTKTETVEGKVTETFKGGQETYVTGDQTTIISGTQTTTAMDINRNASSSMVDKVDNAYGTNTETKEAGKTTTDVSIKGTGEKGQYIRGANESRDYLIKGTLKNSETKTAEATSTEITDGNGKTSSTIQDVTQISGSVTDGTNTSVSNVKANSIDSAVTDGSSISTINQKKNSITSQVTDGTTITKTEQDTKNITNTAKDGTITNDAKDIVNNASGNMTNTVGGDLKTTVSGNELHEVTGKQTNKIDGDQENTIGGNQTTTVTGDISNKAENITNEANTKLTDKVGENTRVLDSEGITDTVGGSTFKQRIDKIMMESKDVSIKAEETLTNEAKVITNKASEVINNEAVNINNTATGIITSKASEIKNQADKLISNKVGENTWENMENGKITTSIKDGAKQNLTQSDAAGTTQSTVDGGKSTVTIQNADGLADAVTDGTNTSVQNQTASAIAAAVKDGAGNENASVANATTSVNTIKSGSKANTVISTADGTSFINSEAAAPVGDGTEVKTTIKGNTITTGKVTMDYAEVMKDLGVRGNANITGKTTTGSLEVTGTSTLKGDVTMGSNATVKKDLTVEGNTNLKNTKVDGTLDVTQKATFGDSVSIAKDLSVDGNATIKGDVTAKSYKVGDKTYISAAGINANDQKITNVADGSISEGSKDAVNGGQLYTVKNDLEGKVNKVGANAAAMANLHPMEFDPDSKWNIAAAIGNYGSETAAALGAFYRPNDDVMVNLSTAFGTGENMVGGGVSVRLGKGGNKLSREESNALKDQVNDLTARMDALLSVLNPNMSKDFPDVPENHWAYEAVSRLAGNDIVQGYPDGEFHGDRTMTRYEMAEIIYNALSRGAEAETELVEEFKPELQAMAASEKATAEKAEG